MLQLAFNKATDSWEFHQDGIDISVSGDDMLKEAELVSTRLFGVGYFDTTDDEAAEVDARVKSVIWWLGVKPRS